MPTTTALHHLICALRDGSIWFPEERDALDVAMACKALDETPSFVFDGRDGEAAVTVGAAIVGRRTPPAFDLPFPVIVEAVLPEDGADARYVLRVRLYREGALFVIPYLSGLTGVSDRPWIGGLGVCHLLADGMPFVAVHDAVPARHQARAEALLHRALALGAGFAGLFQHMRLTIEEAFQPEELNAARARRGQEPVRDFMVTRLVRAPQPSPEAVREAVTGGGFGPK